MNQRGILKFELWGIPVSIYPLSWLLLLFLGGGLSVDSGTQLAGVLLFVVAGMLCLLAHEMGHATVARKLTGYRPVITISGLGGSTQMPRLPRTRQGYFLVVFAGPLATLLLGILGGLALGVQIGNPADGLAYALLYPLPLSPNHDLMFAVYNADIWPLLLAFYHRLFIVCVWWTIFNLLPIFPLDGGKLLGTLLNNDKLAALIGLIFGGLLTLFFLLLALLGGSLFNVLIVGYLTYINYTYYRHC